MNASCQPESRWPHRLAVMSVCATFPLIWIGALVTTTDAGMAVPDWPNTFGYNMFAYPLSWWISGPWDLFIEHGHRLFASGVGLLMIALAIVLWKKESRRWVIGVGFLALGMVIFQGVLGGLRVVLAEVTLAKIHGCFGPLFFAVCVALACFTSRWWKGIGDERLKSPSAGSLQTIAVMTAAFAYLQLMLGAQVRHVAPGADPASFRVAVWAHVILAFVVLGYCLLAAFTVWFKFRNQPLLLRPALSLGGLVLVQLALGVATWVSKYGWPGSLGEQTWAAREATVAGGMTSSMIVTAHVAAGSLIFVIAVALALRACRLLQREASGAVAASRVVGNKSLEAVR